MKLRLNGALEEVVEAFKKARPEIVELTTKSSQVAEHASPKRKRREEKREEEVDSRKRLRTSGRRTKSSQTEVVEVMDSANEDEDYAPGELLEDGRLFAANYCLEDGTVQCPVCQKRVKEAGINSHLDQNCMDEPRVTKSLSRSNKRSSMSAPKAPDNPIKRPDPLPAINYQFVKDPALKKKLTDQGLSAAGPRQLLERRYTEWCTLWNANCDATRPKSKSELKRELDTWDRTLGKNTTSLQGAQIKDKDFDGKGWSNSHNDDFKDLIAKARSKVKKPATPIPEVSSATTNSSIPASETPLQADTEMAHNSPETVDSSEDSPSKSRSHFFEEGHSNPDPPSDSQNMRKLTLLEKDTGITPDVRTSLL